MLVSKICQSINVFQNRNNSLNVEKNIKTSTNPFAYSKFNILTSDVFVKSPENISFTSRRGIEGKTTEGKVLKQFDGIRGAYSGLPLISVPTMDRLKAEIDNAQNPKDMLGVIKPYKDYLQPVQAKLYDDINEYLKQNPSASIKDYLEENLQNSVIRLGQKERQVLAIIKPKLDTIQNSNDRKKLKQQVLSGIAKTRDYVEEEKENGDSRIIGSNFRRGKLIGGFKAVRQRYVDANNQFYSKNNEIIFNNLENLYDSLPESRFDEDAFVVTYAQPEKNDSDIVKALITPSMLTIEHIKTVNHGGKNNLRNFMATSDAKNSKRDNDYLEDFVRKNPDVKKYCQWYADDIMKLIKEGKMEGYEWYPYALKDTLYTESKGLIEIDISEMNLSDEEVQAGITKYEAERAGRMQELAAKYT